MNIAMNFGANSSKPKEEGFSIKRDKLMQNQTVPYKRELPLRKDDNGKLYQSPVGNARVDRHTMKPVSPPRTLLFLECFSPTNH